MLCLALLASGCGPGGFAGPAALESRRKSSLEHFGTVCSLLLFDDFSAPGAVDRFESTWAEVDALLGSLDAAVSMDIPGSDVARFNGAKEGESIAISPLTAGLITKAKAMYDLTGGAFNPAVANLVDLWGFSPRFRKTGGAAMPYDRPANPDGSLPLPERRYVEAFRRLADFSSVELGQDRAGNFHLTKQARDIVVDGRTYSLRIDLGGIAKGYGADKALEIVRAKGYSYGYINLGMSSLQLLKRNVPDKGAKGRNAWAVSMPDPRDRSENYLDIFGRDTGVSTSGTDLHYTVAGREYSHIIDPATGEPTAGDIASVTILGPDAGYDDALTTALCVMGKAKARAFLDTRMKGYRVVLLSHDGPSLDLVTNMAEKDYALAKREPSASNP